MFTQLKKNDAKLTGRTNLLYLYERRKKQIENKMTKEQELEELKRYVEYTLKNIDDFERRIRKERRKTNGKQVDKRTN